MIPKRYMGNPRQCVANDHCFSRYMYRYSTRRRSLEPGHFKSYNKGMPLKFTYIHTQHPSRLCFMGNEPKKSKPLSILPYPMGCFVPGSWMTWKSNQRAKPMPLVKSASWVPTRSGDHFGRGHNWVNRWVFVGKLWGPNWRFLSPQISGLAKGIHSKRLRNADSTSHGDICRGFRWVERDEFFPCRVDFRKGALVAAFGCFQTCVKTKQLENDSMFGHQNISHFPQLERSNGSFKPDTFTWPLKLTAHPWKMAD